MINGTMEEFIDSYLKAYKVNEVEREIKKDIDGLKDKMEKPKKREKRKLRKQGRQRT